MVTIKAIGQRVLLRRRDLGLTQTQVAQQCGCPYQTICGLERGRQSISAEKLALLAQVLRVSADYLLGLSPEMGGQEGGEDAGKKKRQSKTR